MTDIRSLIGLLDRVSTVEEFYSVTRFFMEAGDDLVSPNIWDGYTTKLVLAWKMAGVKFGSPNSLDVLEEVLNRMGEKGNEIVGLLSQRVDALGLPRRIETGLLLEGWLYIWQIPARPHGRFILGHRSCMKIREQLCQIGLGYGWWLAFFADDLPHQQIIATEDDLHKYGVRLGIVGEGTYTEHLKRARRAVGKKQSCVLICSIKTACTFFPLAVHQTGRRVWLVWRELLRFQFSRWTTTDTFSSNRDLLKQLNTAPSSDVGCFV